jgi:hypothetical protein
MTDDKDITLGNPDPSRGGIDVDEAVATAEKGSQVAGVHTPSGHEESGDSRLEQMREVEQHRVDGSDPGATTPAPPDGPSPADIGAGGAQRIVGARISDRISGGEAVPDGLPFDKDTDGNPLKTSGAGNQEG